MYWLALISISFITITGFTQTGSITIHDHAGATELVEKHIYFNKEHSKLPGWRIQVFSTPQLSEANREKAKLLQQLDDMHATIIFEAPNYKVRVGNYRDRFDANRDLQNIMLYYPNAFICKDLVDVKDL